MAFNFYDDTGQSNNGKLLAGLLSNNNNEEGGAAATMDASRGADLHVNLPPPVWANWAAPQAAGNTSFLSADTGASFTSAAMAAAAISSSSAGGTSNSDREASVAGGGVATCSSVSGSASSCYGSSSNWLKSSGGGSDGGSPRGGTSASSVSSSSSSVGSGRQQRQSGSNSNTASSLWIRYPHPNDILCGRGRGLVTHPGNVQFRTIVSHRKDEYLLSSTQRDKNVIVRHVMEQVKRLDPPGRFLVRDNNSVQDPNDDVGYWIEAVESKAVSKTSQALREGAPNRRAGVRKMLQACARSGGEPVVAASVSTSSTAMSSSSSSSCAGGNKNKKKGIKRARTEHQRQRRSIDESTSDTSSSAVDVDNASSSLSAALHQGYSNSASHRRHVANNSTTSTIALDVDTLTPVQLQNQADRVMADLNCLAAKNNATTFPTTATKPAAQHSQVQQQQQAPLSTAGTLLHAQHSRSQLANLPPQEHGDYNPIQNLVTSSQNQYPSSLIPSLAAAYFQQQLQLQWQQSLPPQQTMASNLPPKQQRAPSEMSVQSNNNILRYIPPTDGMPSLPTTAGPLASSSVPIHSQEAQAGAFMSAPASSLQSSIETGPGVVDKASRGGGGSSSLLLPSLFDSRSDNNAYARANSATSLSVASRLAVSSMGMVTGSSADGDNDSDNSKDNDDFVNPFSNESVFSSSADSGSGDRLSTTSSGADDEGGGADKTTSNSSSSGDNYKYAGRQTEGKDWQQQGEDVNHLRRHLRIVRKRAAPSNVEVPPKKSRKGGASPSRRCSDEGRSTASSVSSSGSDR